MNGEQAPAFSGSVNAEREQAPRFTSRVFSFKNSACVRPLWNENRTVERNA